MISYLITLYFYDLALFLSYIEEDCHVETLLILTIYE